MPRSATRRIAGPGRSRPRCAVLLDQAAALERADAAARRCSWGSRWREASSVSATGCSLSSTRTSRSAPRSTAVVPVRWRPASVGPTLAESFLELLFHGAYIRRAPLASPASSVKTGGGQLVRQRDAALRDPQRGRDGRARPGLAADRLASSGSSSCCPRRSSCCAPPARPSRTRTGSGSIPSSSSSRWRRRRASSSCRRATPSRRAHIGGDHMVFAPVYGCPFIREGDVRRDAKMADFENLVRLSQAFPELDSPGGTICEPEDRPLDSRHLDMVFALQTLSRQAVHGLGHLRTERRRHDPRWARSCSAGARRSSGRRSSISLINVNSPLRYDDRMLGGDVRVRARRTRRS